MPHIGFHGRAISFARLASFMPSYCRLGLAKRAEFGVRFVYDILEGGRVIVTTLTFPEFCKQTTTVRIEIATCSDRYANYV